MSNLPVVPEHERDIIRARLENYMSRHNIGVPTLLEHMVGELDSAHRFYLDLRSLQRFIRNDVRTSDEKVVRYRKFLDVADVDEFRLQFAALVGARRGLSIDGIINEEWADSALVPGDATDRAPRKLADYEGIYALSYFDPNDSQFVESRVEGAPYRFVHPAESGRYLDVISFASEKIDPITYEIVNNKAREEPHSKLLRDTMIRFGKHELLLVEMNPSNGRLALLHDTPSTDPHCIVLDGAGIATPDEGSKSTIEMKRIRLSRVMRPSDTD